MKPTILIENDVFFEDEAIEDNSFKIASKYFDAACIDHFLGVENYIDNIHFLKHNDHPTFWRGSFGMKSQMTRFCHHREDDDKFNCLYWLPALKDFAHNSDYSFLDAHQILKLQQYFWPMFIKPVKGNKAFSGNVFTKEKFQEEYNFFTGNLNIDPYIICQYSPPKPIEKEYRCVIIENRVVDACQYLENAERIDKHYTPKEVYDLAQTIANKDFFLNFPNFVIDIAQNGDIFTLLEVNSIYTSSFYTCDLDKIYSTLAKYYSCSFRLFSI